MTDMNPVSPFVHVRGHSEFSVVDGIVRIPDLVAKVLEYGQPAVALTDLSNVFGLVKFYKAARKAGVKPLAGCDVYVHNDEERDRSEERRVGKESVRKCRSRRQTNR